MFDPRRHHRRSIRLPHHDYGGPGTYFVTVVSANRDCLFSHQRFYSIIELCWAALPTHFRNTALDAWIVMPNHLHALLGIECDEPGNASASGGQPFRLQAASLGAIIGNFKSVSARRINTVRRTPGVAVWQRNYYERIVRDEPELQRIREYIATNPARWALDRENPDRENRPDVWSAAEDVWFGPP